MSAREELEKARGLVLLRRRAWLALLAYPPFAAVLAGHMRGCEQPPTTEIDALEDAASALRERENRVHQQEYEHARKVLADAMHRHRQEATCMRELMIALEALDHGTPGALEVRKPPRGSRVYESYRQDLRRAWDELASARQAFVASNLRLVVRVAGRYRHAFLSQADLIQEGTLGLMRAVDGFDPERGHRFSTYAAWWIRHGITRALSNHGLTIRVPANVLGLRAQLRRLESSFVSAHGRAPSDDELADELGVSPTSVRGARAAVPTRGSLLEVGDVVADEDCPDVEALLDQPVLEARLRELVDELPGIEGAVLRKRFALDGGTSMTLAEVGELHGLSRERIRQLEKQALQRLVLPLAADCGSSLARAC
ncbi:MAG: sigma-70 family RNA polymerase sigma factor [Myxococcales bacterium]|nr:sigma-70 family RNA polymerase sigma factor [Myxococcales bacterium]